MVTTKKVLTAFERDQLVRVCNRNIEAGGQGMRGPLMLMIGLECGLRASEITDLTVEDFNFDERTLFIRSKKGCNARELPIRTRRTNELKRWLLTQYGAKELRFVNPVFPIFPITYTTLHRAWDLYRPAPKKLHSLRHTFAIGLYSKTKDIRVVQLALGHRSVVTTMIYLDFHYSHVGLRQFMHG